MNLLQIAVNVEEDAEHWYVYLHWPGDDSNNPLPREEQKQICRTRSGITARIYAELKREQQIATYRKNPRLCDDPEAYYGSGLYGPGEPTLIGLQIRPSHINGFTFHKHVEDGVTYGGWTEYRLDDGPYIDIYPMSKSEAKKVEATVKRVVKRVLAL